MLVRIQERQAGSTGEEPLDETSALPSPNTAVLQDLPLLDEEAFDLSLLDRTANDTGLGRMGKYEILEVVGYGGMGVVFRAIRRRASPFGGDQSAQAFVGLQQHGPPAFHSRGAGRGRGEPSQRRHDSRRGRTPGASPVGDGVHQRLLVARSHAAGKELDPLEALRISAQIASGLAAAHAQGVIHRDIKPGNIMLEDGVSRVKITDFGLARAAAIDNAELTSRELAVGTPAYMAPEQVRGSEIDARADLFALGCVMYAMLAEHSPFHGQDTPRHGPLGS